MDFNSIGIHGVPTSQPSLTVLIPSTVTITPVATTTPVAYEAIPAADYKQLAGNLYQQIVLLQEQLVKSENENNDLGNALETVIDNNVREREIDQRKITELLNEKTELLNRTTEQFTELLNRIRENDRTITELSNRLREPDQILREQDQKSHKPKNRKRGLRDQARKQRIAIRNLTTEQTQQANSNQANPISAQQAVANLNIVNRHSVQSP